MRASRSYRRNPTPRRATSKSDGHGEVKMAGHAGGRQASDRSRHLNVGWNRLDTARNGGGRPNIFASQRCKRQPVCGRTVHNGRKRGRQQSRTLERRRMVDSRTEHSWWKRLEWFSVHLAGGLQRSSYHRWKFYGRWQHPRESPGELEWTRVESYWDYRQRCHLLRKCAGE